MNVQNHFQKYSSKFILAILFFLHLIKRIFIFWVPLDGFKKFLSHYEKDFILPVSEQERNYFDHYQKCVGCRACSLSCKGVVTDSFFEPYQLFFMMSRSYHELETLNEVKIPCLSCDVCTVYCPISSPIKEVASLLSLRKVNRIG